MHYQIYLIVNGGLKKRPFRVVHGVGSVLLIGNSTDGPQFPLLIPVCITPGHSSNLLGNSFAHATGLCHCLDRAEGYVQCRPW